MLVIPLTSLLKISTGYLYASKIVTHNLRLMSETSRVFNRLKQTASKIRDSDEGNKSQVSKRKPDLTRV